MIKITALLAVVAACNAVTLPQYFLNQQPLTIAHHQPLTIAHHQPTYQLAHHAPHYSIPIQFAAQKPAVVAVAAPAPAPIIVKAAPTAEPVDPHPQYSYSYKVSDAQTGDEKEATETRDGDSVSGKYSVVEPDGSLRTVTYTADKDNGFQATVQREAPSVTAVQVQPAPVIVKEPVKQVIAHRPAPSQAVQFVAIQQSPAYHPIQAIHHTPIHSYAQPHITLASHAHPQYQYVLSH